MKIVTQILSILATLAIVLCAGACNVEQNQVENQESSTTGDGEDVYTVSADPANYYENISQLSRAADFIAYGEIDGVIEVQENIEVGGQYYTDFSFIIGRTLKGNETGGVVIHQLGAVGKMVVIGDPLFQQGEKYILFLHKCDSGIYYVLGGPQGRFKVVDDKVFSMDNISPDEVSISPDLNYDGIELEDFLGIVSAEVD